MKTKLKKLLLTFIIILISTITFKHTVEATDQPSQGWFQINDTWFFRNDDLTLATNKWVGDYYLGSDGKMLTNTWIDNYFVDSSGKWVPNQLKADKVGWFKVGDDWFFGHDNLTLATNKWIGNYYLGNDGKMLTNSWIDNYFVDSSGKWVPNQLKTDKVGWFKIGDDWFFGQDNLTLATNKWIGNYYLGNDGKMLTNSWIDNYFVDSSGKWIPNQLKADKVGWFKVGDDWFFGHDNLTLATNQWIDNYFVDSSGKRTLYNQKMLNKAIFLDPGHGGSDSGAVAYGLKEKDLALAIHNKVAQKLIDKGYQVISSRQSDIDVDFRTERSKLANESNADLFISIHFNSSGKGEGQTIARGIETYWYSYDSDYPPKINQDKHLDPIRLERSEKLAKSIHDNLIKYTNANDRGIKRETFAVLRETAIPAVLLELGFMDNYQDSLLIRDSSYQDKLVQGIIDGILNYYDSFS